MASIKINLKIAVGFTSSNPLNIDTAMSIKVKIGKPIAKIFKTGTSALSWNKRIAIRSENKKRNTPTSMLVVTLKKSEMVISSGILLSWFFPLLYEILRITPCRNPKLPRMESIDNIAIPKE